MEKEETTVDSIMVTDIESVKPDIAIKDVSLMMLDKHIRCVLVCAEDDELKGVITDSDIVFRTTGKTNPLSIPVEEVMTKNPIFVKPTADIYQVVALMGKHGFRRMPIVNNEKLIGIVSVRDIVRQMLKDLHEIQEDD